MKYSEVPQFGGNIINKIVIKQVRYVKNENLLSSSNISKVEIKFRTFYGIPQKIDPAWMLKPEIS